MLRFLIVFIIGFGLGLLIHSTRRHKSLISTLPEPEAIALDSDSSDMYLAEIESLKTEVTTLKQQNEILLSEKQNIASQYREVQRQFDDFVEDYEPSNRLSALELENRKLEGQQKITQRELSETKARLEQLQQTNTELLTENKSLQNHINKLVLHPTSGGQKQITYPTDLILRSTEVDLYPQEKYDILLKILQEKLKNTRKKTRRFYLLQDILQHNHPTSYEDNFMSEIRAIFKGFTHFSPHQKKQLAQLGFELSEQGKHIKAIFRGDPRCQVSFSKSCSDKKRGGLNVITQIRRRLF